MSERFGEIRSILNRGESARNWTRLCDTIDGIGEGELDQMVFPYVAGHVREWNPRTCVAPREWVYRALRGEELAFWSMVRALDLSQEYLNSEELRKLLRSDRIAQIEVIDLESNRIGAAGAQLIAEAEHLGHLEELRLGFNRLKCAGVLWLGRADVLQGLRHLRVGHNALEDVGGTALSKAPWFGQLETLDLANNGLHANAIAQILERLDQTGRITHLVLDHNSMSRNQKPVKLLARGFEQLERLDLRGCELSDKQIQVLGDAPSWERLTLLDLGRNPITAAGLTACLTGGEFPALRRVYLGGTNVTSEVLAPLSALQSLEYVELPGGIAHVREADELRAQGVRVVDGR